jgi:hypothetical protein
MGVSFRTLSESEQAFRVYQEFGRAINYHDKNVARSLENFQYYWGRDGEKGMGQWPAAVAAEMSREGRFIATYNFCQPIVDNIAGAMMKAPYSIEYTPTEGELNSLTMMLKNMLYVDKELTDWSSAALQIIIGGLIHESVGELYINREYNRKFGNIGLRARLPGSVVFDPLWRSHRQKDLRKCWATAWMTPLEMIETWDDKGDDIMRAMYVRQNGGVQQALRSLAEMQRQYGDEYGANTGINPYNITDEQWGSQYRVVQQYSLRKEKVKFEFAATPHGNIILPIELEHPAEKIAWLNENASDWQPDAIFEDEDWEDVQYTDVLCPQLSMNMLLDTRPTEVQCGRIQFFPYSANRINGEAGGIIDAIKDTQKQINYWESLLTHKIQTEGGGGSQFVDPEGFQDTAEMQNYIQNRNNPRKAFKLKAGYLRKNPGGPAVPTRKSEFPSEVTAHLQHLIETVLPRISKVTPAAQGRSEASNESGYLFRLKKLQTDIERFTIHEGLRHWWNDIGDAYMFLAARHYGNGIEREFYDPRTKGTFRINERAERGGREVLLNDFARLREMRHRVVVSESEESPTRKVEVMTVASEVMRSLPQSQQLTITKMGTIVAKSLDNFDVDDQEELDEFGKLEIEFARQSMKTQVAEMRLREVSALGQTNILSQQQGGAPGGEQSPPPGSADPITMAAGQRSGEPGAQQLTMPHGAGGGDAALSPVTEPAEAEMMV